MEPMNKEEIEAKAKEVFGPNAEVYYSDSQWMIRTQVEEKFDPEPYRGTAAFEAYEEYEATYGSTLDRWMYKNGHGYGSMVEGFEAYNANWESNIKDSIGIVRKMIAEDRPFDWAGGPEYRDGILKLAEERGW